MEHRSRTQGSEYDTAATQKVAGIALLAAVAILARSHRRRSRLRSGGRTGRGAAAGRDSCERTAPGRVQGGTGTRETARARARTVAARPASRDPGIAGVSVKGYGAAQFSSGWKDSVICTPVAVTVPCAPTPIPNCAKACQTRLQSD